MVDQGYHSDDDGPLPLPIRLELHNAPVRSVRFLIQIFAFRFQSHPAMHPAHIFPDDIPDARPTIPHIRPSPHRHYSTRDEPKHTAH